ncbi:HAMP domain-containing sensor histidine kinase [Spirosoma sp.]|uniref:sensor histidine kinase n=1 Tax=Spirosoma sp. TaxID=1899569 RepID=UPI0026220078|nr:HAMP domain-containing sensor histidine kinase [Spirosoma sp.]MCX6218639.1 HAMP domain-containing sensor histidine kinase [Spirosoma sp.]
MKIRTRLSLTFIAVVLPVLLLLLVTIYLYVDRSKQDDFLIKLRNRGITMAQLLVEKRVIREPLLRQIDRKTQTAYSDRRVAIFDSQNRLLYDSGELDNRTGTNSPISIDAHLLNQIDSEREVRFSNGRRVGLGLLVEQPGQRLKVISYAIDDYGIRRMKEAVAVMGFMLGIAVLLVVVLSRLFASRSVRPITGMIRQINQITPSNIDVRLTTPSHTDELAQLAHTFNLLLDRLSAFELQRSFIANASHELRTPLSVLTNQIEVALMKPRPALEYEQLLTSMQEDIRRLNSLSNGLLELTQLDNRQAGPGGDVIALDEVLYEAVGLVIRKQPTYRITLGESTASTDESNDGSNEALPDVMLNGDSSLLKTAFINLIDNGCKFSDSHQVHLKVVVFDTLVQVAISDQGIGIAADELDYIMQPFYRAANARAIKGNGIGLSLTARIIQLHGGTLTVNSQLGCGTTITVSLPRMQSPGR